MILGDSLLVMTSLAEKEGLQGQGPDDLHRPALRHQVRLELAGQHAQARRQGRQGRATSTRQPEQIRAFRDTWKLGIHSYLAYLRDRLVVARELLTESGSASSSRSATRTSISSARCSTRCLAARTSCSQITFRKTAAPATAELHRRWQRLTTSSGTPEIESPRQVSPALSPKKRRRGRWRRIHASRAARWHTASDDPTRNRATERLLTGGASLPPDNLTSQTTREAQHDCFL